MGSIIRPGTDPDVLEDSKILLIEELLKTTQEDYETIENSINEEMSELLQNPENEEGFDKEQISLMESKTKILKNQRGFQTKIAVKSNLYDYSSFSEEIKDDCCWKHKRNQPRCSRML